MKASRSVAAPFAHFHLSWSFGSSRLSLSCTDDAPAWASRHPIAGVGAHSGGSVVVLVVDVTTVLVVEDVVAVVAVVDEVELEVVVLDVDEVVDDEVVVVVGG